MDDPPSPAAVGVLAERSGENCLADGTCVVRLGPGPTVQDALVRLCGLPHCLLLDSARRGDALGRFSFLTADPFDFIRLPPGAADPFGALAARLAPLACAAIPGLPPFQGGVAGLFSYELCRSIERIPEPKCDEFGLPAVAVGLYDFVIAWDHVERQAWIVARGLPETDPSRRQGRARKRTRQVLRWLQRAPATAPRAPSDARPSLLAPDEIAPSYQAPAFTGQQSPVTHAAAPGAAVCPSELQATRWPVSNFSPQAYLAAVRRGIEYIHAGDVFQVNLSQRLLAPARRDSVDLYLRLRQRNPAPMAGYFDVGGFQILSASPERFLRVQDRNVESRPIKGTRPRGVAAEADLYWGDALQQSEKDRAENCMIVDLMRNDLSRVCLPDSVDVPQLCRLEVFEFVQHLVSTVVGRLAPDRTPLDLLAAAFPGGSITGAPKIRAMEIIAELEPTARGAYCGSLGYLGFDGSLDTSILIRTITAGRGWWQAPVGGGIVADSVAEREYEETRHKASGLIQVMVE